MKTLQTEASSLPIKKQTTTLFPLVILSISSFLFSSSSVAEKIELVENPAQSPNEINDSWIVNYDINDFDEKIRDASILYIPQNFGKQAAFFMRCKPFFTNFSLQYTEQKANLIDDGELPNASSKFAKHGYVYDDKQTLSVNVNGDNESYDISVGGQIKHLTKLFKTKESLQPDQLGMSLFFSFTFKEMPSFRSETTTDDATDFFKKINLAIQKTQPINFNLESDQDWQRQFTLNTKRMVNFVPSEVLGFCLSKRQLK